MMHAVATHFAFLSVQQIWAEIPHLAPELGPGLEMNLTPDVLLSVLHSELISS